MDFLSYYINHVCISLEELERVIFTDMIYRHEKLLVWLSSGSRVIQERSDEAINREASYCLTLAFLLVSECPHS